MDTPSEIKLAEIATKIYNLYWYHERSKDNFGELCKLTNRYAKLLAKEKNKKKGK